MRNVQFASLDLLLLVHLHRQFLRSSDQRFLAKARSLLALVETSEKA